MAETVLNASADVHIYAGGATTNYASDTENIISGDRQFWDIYRTLISFDLSGIPAGSTINSATLELYQHAESHSGSGSTNHSIYRLKRNWVEDQATWNVYSTGNSWSSAGAFHADDCEQTPIATTALGGTTGSGYKSWSLDPDAISEIVEGTWTNYGFLLKSQTESDDGHHFRPSEYVESAQRPKLTIDYTEGASGTTVTLSTAALTAAGQTMTTAPGAVTTALDTAALTAGGQALSVVPGAATIALATALLQATGISTGVVPGTATVALATAALTAAGIGLTIVPGSVSVDLATATITAAGIQIIISSGESPPQTIVLDTATLTAAGVALGVVPGEATVDLATAMLTAAGGSASVVPGAVTTALDTATITAGGQSLTVTPGEALIALATGELTAAGISLDVVPGAVTIGLSTAELTALGVALIVAIVNTVFIPGGSIASSGAASTIGGGGAGSSVISGSGGSGRIVSGGGTNRIH